MKKVFSLILAVAMVLSLASVAFAAVTPWEVKTTGSSSDAVAVKNYDTKAFYLYDSDAHTFTKSTTGKTLFAKTVYYPLFVDTVAGNEIATQDKSASSLKLTIAFEAGEEYVDSYAIVKKYGKSAGTDFYGYDKDHDKFFNGYYIAITTKGTATAAKDVSGVMTVTGKTGSGSTKIKDEAVHFAFQLDWAHLATATDFTYLTDTNALEDGTALKLAKKTKYVVKGTGDEVDFFFNADVKYTVTMVEGEKVVLNYNETANTAIEDANDLAGISFYNFNNVAFKRAGDLFITADDEEPGYCYEILADGSLKDITSTYDEEEGAFVLKVKKLGAYCTSDLKLVDAEGTVAAMPGEVNPVTGAIA